MNETPGCLVDLLNPTPGGGSLFEAYELPTFIPPPEINERSASSYQLDMITFTAFCYGKSPRIH